MRSETREVGSGTPAGNGRAPIKSYRDITCAAIADVTPEEIRSLVDGYEVIGKLIYRLAESWKTFDVATKT